MADGVTQQPVSTNETTRGRRRRGRVIWTVQMNRDLLECKEMAQQLVASVEPPLYPNGRKKGYMRVMWEKWNEKGYAGLDFSSQNLRDQAGHLEKSKGMLETPSSGVWRAQITNNRRKGILFYNLR